MGSFGKSWIIGLVGVAAVALGASCIDVREDAADVPESRTSIYGGSVHTGHPAVGALAYAGSSYFCTGTLIAPRVVLTAAHCAGGSGTVFRIGTSSWAPAAEIDVVGWRVPSQWNGTNYSWDIALAELEWDAPVAPIPFNRAAANVAPGKVALFIGYGEDQNGGSGVKRAVSMMIEWRGTYSFSYGDSVHNTCYGDSGGPALVVDGAGIERVVGVTSHGDANCTVNGVDTRSDKHQAWIDAEIADIVAADPEPEPPPPGGCGATTCGGQAPNGCWCDSACRNYGDCCTNACGICGMGC